MYRKQLNVFHPVLWKLALEMIVYKDEKEIGRYKRINGSYTVWVMNIGRLKETYRTKEEAYQAIINGYVPYKRLDSAGVNE